MVNLLKMNFPDDNLPDIGSIRFDRFGEHLHLLNDDIPKLNSTLTRAVCAETYDVTDFYFQSGDCAFVDDTQRAFVYNSDSDEWVEWVM
jgi:hypothetical protein